MFFCSSVVSLPLQAADQVLVLQPQALFGVRDVRELGADGAAVGVFELGDDLAQLEPGREFVGTRAGEEFGVEIGIGQPEVAELEHPRARALLETQRVEIGDQVAAVGVDLHEARHRALLGGGIAALRCRGRRGHARFAGALHDAGLDGGVDLFGAGAVRSFRPSCRCWK